LKAAERLDITEIGLYCRSLHFVDFEPPAHATLQKIGLRMAGQSSFVALFDNQLVWNVLGLAAFTLHDASSWRWWHYFLWAALIAGAMEILAKLVIAGGKVFGMDKEGKKIKDSAKPLMELDTKDVIFITINKLLTAAFTYHVIRYCWHSNLIAWNLSSINWLNTGFALLALYTFYDFWYYWFHRILHIPALYPLVHKHHHRQHSPFRGNADAINVHLFGEWPPRLRFVVASDACARFYWTGFHRSLHT
jgi:hypothetical protein